MTFEAGTRKLRVIRYIITEMDVHERQAVGRRIVESAAETRHTIVLLGIGALLQTALLMWVYCFIRHDITERRRAPGELQRRGELLEAASKELESFSYSVSHDLRAPLRYIDGYAALLRQSVEPSLNDKAVRYLQTIADSARQLEPLIDDLFYHQGRRKGNGTSAVDPVWHRHGKRRWIGCNQRERSGDTFRYMPPGRCKRDRGTDRRERTVAIDSGS